MEKALLGSAFDVDTLIQALQALPQDLYPTPTPGMLCLQAGANVQMVDLLVLLWLLCPALMGCGKSDCSQVN